MKQTQVIGLIITLVTLVGTAVAAVWSARDHAEIQVQRLEAKLESAIKRHEEYPHKGAMSERGHTRDIDRIMNSLDRIDKKLDNIAGKCNCLAR